MAPLTIRLPGDTHTRLKESARHRRIEQITIPCSPSTSGALRLTLRPNGLPFVLSVAERSRSMNAGSRPA